SYEDDSIESFHMIIIFWMNLIVFADIILIHVHEPGLQRIDILHMCTRFRLHHLLGYMTLLLDSKEGQYLHDILSRIIGSKHTAQRLVEIGKEEFVSLTDHNIEERRTKVEEAVKLKQTGPLSLINPQEANAIFYRVAQSVLGDRPQQTARVVILGCSLHQLRHIGMVFLLILPRSVSLIYPNTVMPFDHFAVF
ncbi:hypothetical protein ACJX0J_020344, partial [Zea mays]